MERGSFGKGFVAASLGLGWAERSAKVPSLHPLPHFQLSKTLFASCFPPKQGGNPNRNKTRKKQRKPSLKSVTEKT